MDIDHLTLFVSMKTLVSYSILNSLYEAAQEGSLVLCYLSQKEVLGSMRIFAAQPRSFRDIQKGLDAKRARRHNYSLRFLQKLYLTASGSYKREVEDSFHGYYLCCVSTEREDVFNCVLEYHIWSKDGELTGLVSQEDCFHLFSSARCFPHIIRFMKAFFDEEINQDGYDIFDIFEDDADVSIRFLELITTKEEMLVFEKYLEYSTAYEDKILQRKRHALGMIPEEEPDEDDGWEPAC